MHPMNMLIATTCMMVGSYLFPDTLAKDTMLNADDRNEQVVRASLLNLSQVTAGDSYLSIVDRRSQRVLQFTGGRDVPLCVILSAESLRPEEIPAATATFASFGILRERQPFSLGPGHSVAGETEIFSGCLADYESGVRLTLEVFRDVYSLSEKPLLHAEID
jgi:hypothetical protein